MSSARATKRAREALASAAAAASVIALWLSSPAAPAGADSSPGFKPVWAICLTKSEQPRGKHSYKPRRCTLHARGAFPIDSTNTKALTQLRWKRWNERRAVGRGKSWISTVGRVRARVVLRRPRFRCGEWVFTRAQITERVRQPDGTVILSIGTMRPDNCLPLRRR